MLVKIDTYFFVVFFVCFFGVSRIYAQKSTETTPSYSTASSIRVTVPRPAHPLRDSLLRKQMDKKDSESAKEQNNKLSAKEQNDSTKKSQNLATEKLDSLKNSNDTSAIAQNDSVNAKPKAKSDSIESPIDYTATDSIAFGVKEKSIDAYKEASIQYQDINLKADAVNLDMKKREVYAMGVQDSTKKTNGRPNFKQGDQVFDSDTIRYNFDSKKGIVTGIITKQEDGYLHSDRTKIMPNKEVYLRSGKYTTCENRDPHFYVKMSRAKVIPNDKIITGPAWLVIEDIPIPLVLPFGYFPNKKGRASGVLIPQWGDDAQHGYNFKGGGVYLGLSEYFDLKLTGDFYTLGSFRTFATSNYYKRYKFKGSLQFAYSSLVENEVRQPFMYSVQWTHTQDAKACPNRSFSASVNYQSQGYSKKNSTTTDQYMQTAIRSNIQYSKTFPNSPFNMSSAFSHSQNLKDSTITLTLPQVHAGMTTVYPMRSKKAMRAPRWYENIGVSVSSDAQNTLTNAKMDSTFYTKKTLDLFQYGVKHSAPITTSIKFLKYFSLNPSVNLTERWYFQRVDKHWDADALYKTKKTDTVFKKGRVITDTSRGFYRVWDYSLSTSVNTTIYGMYLFKSQVLKAMRHIVTPSVSFSYQPDYGKDKWGYWGSTQTDSVGRKTQYSHYANGMYGTPAAGEQRTVSFSIGNNLQIKVRDLKDTVKHTRVITLIESFSISTGYNFARDSMRWNNIAMNGSTRLFNRITVNYAGNFSPYAQRRNNFKDLIAYNKLMWDKYGKVWRPIDETWSLGTSLQLGPQKKAEAKTDDASKKIVPEYAAFAMPWSLSLNYSLSLPRVYYFNENNHLDSIHSIVRQTLTASGSVTITKNWSVRVSSGWDFTNNGITPTTFDIVRDLHCWTMAFNWVPFGAMQRYSFQINAKAKIFQDLKYKKQQTSGQMF